MPLSSTKTANTTNVASISQSKTQLNIVLLAAGKGLRFQQSYTDAKKTIQIKQLANLNGMPMIRHSINQLRPLTSDNNISNSTSNNIYVALGANHQKISAELPEDVTPLLTKNFYLGMGHTITESVTRIADESSHILIALADQVLIDSHHYQQLINKSLAEPEKIIATLSDNKMMAPAIFPKMYFSELMKLQGDKGAGSLLKRKTNQVITHPCSAAEFDIDTLADLEQISQLIKLENSCSLSTIEPRINTQKYCQNMELI
jgi:molybdenum cofactor cytidylyltransferase